MARGRGARVSLFPFMSVLACTIGALILLLTSLALSAVAPRSEGGAERGAASGRSDGGAKSAAERVAERAEEEVRADRLEALLARRDALERQAAVATSAASGEAEDGVSRRAAMTRRLESDRAALEADRAGLEGERATVEAEIEVLESRRATIAILIDPTGLSRRLDPWFVECDARGATLHNVDDGFSLFVPRDELSLSSDLPRYLRRLRAMPGALLVLLIREEGLRTATATEAVASALHVRVAQLPLPGKGEIDWSLLRERRQAVRR